MEQRITQLHKAIDGYRCTSAYGEHRARGEHEGMSIETRRWAGDCYEITDSNQLH